MQESEPSHIDEIVAEYNSKLRLYEEFADSCKDLVDRLIDAAGLKDRVHSVSARPKEVDKLREKCEAVGRAGQPYETLADVTDLAGVRIITFFTDDVDKIGQLIESEFSIDRDNSIDKRKVLAPDSFGYLSLHYVCNLSHERASLTEHKRFADLAVEIQVRSILQHGWAEIEHDLGYKNPEGIPEEARRRFSRLAGLLELADDEFVRLRQDLSAYAIRVERDISRIPSDILVDKVSLRTFAEINAMVRELDEFMASSMQAELDPHAMVDDFVPMILYIKLQTIADVLEALQARKELIAEQFKRRFAGHSHKGETVGRGICLFHLSLVMIAEQGDPSLLTAAYDLFNIGSKRRRKRETAELFSLIQELSNPRDSS